MQARPGQGAGAAAAVFAFVVWHGASVTNTRTQHNCRTLDVVFLWPHACRKTENQTQTR